MAELPSAFNSEEVDDDFDVIPAGKYVAEIVKSEMRETKAKTGQFLFLQMKILKGDHKGRVLFDRLNLVNPNETAVEIARKTLKRICDAVGKKKITDSKVLHDTPMNVQVSIKPADDNWPAGNEIKGYYKIDGNSQSASNANPFKD